MLETRKQLIRIHSSMEWLILSYRNADNRRNHSEYIWSTTLPFTCSKSGTSNTMFGVDEGHLENIIVTWKLISTEPEMWLTWCSA